MFLINLNYVIIISRGQVDPLKPGLFVLFCSAAWMVPVVAD